ncbi:hypothetical protein A6X20_01275 [Bradyrhizobium elkanii]|nr:hypothetical protein A6452_16565 [Bradyrhizobium elkanii]ODM86300.1 hypothetical protein A6X20_01275 [Bradyrhizobium elkanii]
MARLQLLADGRSRIPDFIHRLTKLFLRDTERMSPAFHLVGRMQIDLRTLELIFFRKALHS